ncbi:hypothetical protein L596_029679 [Steinernema carpocapsae]|uniref:Uncharacterized protein n=1 Tax=Steinernema carpocapsae TaxID=34508 RepID=A0A4U5LQG1_STECR|nr:hypothetical protein L596_029679 [Steinernema carpocapsae]
MRQTCKDSFEPLISKFYRTWLEHKIHICHCSLSPRPIHSRPLRFYNIQLCLFLRIPSHEVQAQILVKVRIQLYR